MSDPETMKQVAAQCRAVAHMAKALAEVYEHKAKTIELGGMAQIVDYIGQRSAELMEDIGNMLNGMDAVDDAEDAWMDPIFEEAQRRWPLPQHR